MCGIVGFIATKHSAITPPQFRRAVNHLLVLSESRGQDASGVAIVTDDSIQVYKRSIPAKQIVRASPYHHLYDLPVRAAIGHARMETNGSQRISYNNQPVVNGDLVTIHNGIVSNDQDLWRRHPEIRRQYQVDTEVINALIQSRLDRGLSVIAATQQTYQELEGSATIATLNAKSDQLLLATNTGSLFFGVNSDRTIFFFASERQFLEKFIDHIFSGQSGMSIQQLRPGSGLLVSIATTEQTPFPLHQSGAEAQYPVHPKGRRIQVLSPEERTLETSTNSGHQTQVAKLMQEEHERIFPLVQKLRRCTRCILPETMPFIEFDETGVCNYCRYYTKQSMQPTSELIDTIRPYRRNDGRPDCLIPFSGGRDSSFGLHYAKQVLGLNPVAYSYDWGMLTDLGRRNQARMCGRLGVEHIIISANIHQKRANIRKNVMAWLHRPKLATIPLFMAGDKHYFYYANKLRKQMGLDLVVYLENKLEKTDFKSGFCGIKPKQNISHMYNLGISNKLKMMAFYGKEFMANPSFMNSTMLDSMKGYAASYFIPHDYLFLFNYLAWDENEINSTLIDSYNWERSDDTPTTWRIGDGTVPFYNYIYYTVAGFTEIDTFRSNQIREGQMSREEALRKSYEENRPRVDSTLWYGDTIGIDMVRTITAINHIPKLFGQST